MDNDNYKHNGYGDGDGDEHDNININVNDTERLIKTMQPKSNYYNLIPNLNQIPIHNPRHQVIAYLINEHMVNECCYKDIKSHIASNYCLSTWICADKCADKCADENVDTNANLCVNICTNKCMNKYTNKCIYICKYVPTLCCLPLKIIFFIPCHLGSGINHLINFFSNTNKNYLC